MSNRVENMINDIKNNVCLKNFQKASSEEQVKIIMKVCAAALAAGLILGYISAIVAIPGMFIAGSVAFGFLTDSTAFTKKAAENVNRC